MNAPVAFRTITNMTSKGQVLIPKEIRERAGLVPGGPVSVTIDERGQVLVTRVPMLPENEEARRAAIRASILSVAGSIATGRTTDEMMIELRGDEPFL